MKIDLKRDIIRACHPSINLPAAPLRSYGGARSAGKAQDDTGELDVRTKENGNVII